MSWPTLRMQRFIENAIQLLLCKGKHDAPFLGWPDEDFIARAQHRHAALSDVTFDHATRIPEPKFAKFGNFSEHPAQETSSENS